MYSQAKQQIGCKNPFIGLNPSVLSCDSRKSEIIISSFIDQFDGPELSQHEALITIFDYKAAAFLSKHCHISTQIC